ncbi:hypothetical protein WKK05_41730 (plasmid) [Nostoc sp. UHCC 0302]|uniref:hypothetical protein n=1 Tax=Nostoc sp. UHCC 0302 TaxID=3134896 RepID=UPI00311CBC23
MKSVYIFVTTDRPDIYINSIVHWLKKGINQIFLIQVEDNKIEQVKLNLLRLNIYNLLKDLASGFYRYYTGTLRDTLIDLSNEYNNHDLAEIKSKYNSWYSQIISDDIRCETVPPIKYLELKQYISSIYKKNKNIIIDVTPVSKIYIADILACCLLENINSLYTFELLITPDFGKPWKILIHELDEGKQYKYSNLVETPIFQESAKAILFRTTPLLISIVGTILFVSLTLAASFFFGALSSFFVQVVSIVGTVLGIISFFLIYFPIRGK